MQVKKCRICGNKKFKKIFSLGDQALANKLHLEVYDEKKFPLSLIQCTHCTLIQLSYVVPKEDLFDNYLYIPSVSKTHLEHFKQLSSSLIKDLKLKKGSLVVDIGSSDGSLLKFFEKRGMMITGIEPAQNIESTVHTYRSYFTPELAQTIVNKFGKAKLATATNVFAHIDDLQEFIKSLDVLLDEDGVFFAQFPDVRNLLAENQFDTIYHEHLSYFTYEPLHHLFSNSPFELFRVDNSTIHGGSMRIYVRRRKELLSEFSFQVDKIKDDLLEYIKKEKSVGKEIAAFGAAAKGMVLLQYLDLNDRLINFVADGTPYKQGKFTPGTHIPIVTEEQLASEKIDIVIILAWNFKEEIMEKLKNKGYTFVVPIPNVKIYENSNS